MGSLVKSPKAPTIQYISPPAPVITSSVSEPESSKKTDAQIAAESRTESLLRRTRGRLGTITTSFRGFLDSSDKENTAQRKTLLGE